MAFVAGVRALSISDGSIFQWSRELSTRTGVAPACRIAFTEAANVKAGATTSSPAPIFSASSARCSATVPLATLAAYGLPKNRAKSSSNRATYGPDEDTQPERIASTRYVSSLPENTVVEIGIFLGSDTDNAFPFTT